MKLDRSKDRCSQRSQNRLPLRTDRFELIDFPLILILIQIRKNSGRFFSRALAYEVNGFPR